MALVLPTHPLPGIRRAVLRLARACRALPDAFTVRLVLVPGGDHPDLLLQDGGRFLAIWVREDAADEVRAWRQGQTRLAWDEDGLAQRVDAAGRAWSALPRAHAFVHGKGQGTHAAGDTIFGAELWSDPAPLAAHMAEVPDGQRAVLLAALFPELVVPADLSVRARGQEARLSPQLLDSEQESAVKSELYLPDVQRRTAENTAAQVITGVAGSGKSLVLLYRLRLLRAHFPDRFRRALVLTHNRALLLDLEARYHRLAGEPGDGLRFHTFMAWSMETGRGILRHRTPLAFHERKALLAAAHAEHVDADRLSLEQFTQEVDWLKDQGLPDRETYRTLPRTGLGLPLRQDQRMAVYDALDAYQRALAERDAIDWSDVALLPWQQLRQGWTPSERYDLILVDECQFFAPIWFDLLRAVLDPDQGRLTLVADPSQGFLRRRQSWKSLGIEARGQVKRLDQSYRNTRAILAFATLFYRQRQPADGEAILSDRLEHLEPGVLPFILPVRSPLDEIHRACNETKAYLDAGGKPRDILLVHCASEHTPALRAHLVGLLGAERVEDPRHPNPNDSVRVISLEAATGLEAKVVCIVGAHHLYEREQALRLSEEERADLQRENTRKLYTAITRAGQRLLITYWGPIPNELREGTQPG